MSNRPSSFIQKDITRAYKGAVAGGMPVARMEIDQDGKIVIIAGDDECDDRNEVDRAFGCDT